MRNGIQYGVDTADVLSTVAECDASASGGKGTTQVASAKALSELNSNLEEELGNSLGGLRFGIDSAGNYGYKKVGADTVIPFKTYSDNVVCFTYGFYTKEKTFGFGEKVKKIKVSGQSEEPNPGTLVISGSDDNSNWKEIGRITTNASAMSGVEFDFGYSFIKLDFGQHGYTKACAVIY